MKAIDFACNLLKTISEHSMSEACIRVMFCIAAGLHYKEDINNFLNNGCNNGNTGNTLRRLEHMNFIVLKDRDTEYYSLTEKGKSTIAHLLRFLPTHT